MMTSCGKTENEPLSTETEVVGKNECETEEIETEQSDVVAYVDYLTENGSGIAIERPPVDDMKEMFRTEQCSPLDIRWYDCNFLDEEAEKVLLETPYNVDFNEDTVFSDTLKEAINPEVLLENGKNPGLGIKALHEQGIDGSGVGIAIIDQGLYTKHPEYASKIKLYEEINVLPNEEASMHGAALASISVGETCGVAPGADLYFWGYNNIKPQSLEKEEYDDSDINYAGYANVIDRVIEVNEQLAEDKKIRVIAIARGYGKNSSNPQVKAEIDELIAAVRRAEDAGIFVITTSTGQNYDFFSKLDKQIPFAGLGKVNPAGDADDVENYTLGSWEWDYPSDYEQSVLIPMDDRTTADMSGDTYVYYADGGWSWTVPYIAGVYALCVQVKPDITPELFYQAAWETSTEIVRTRSETDSHGYTFHVINPKGIIEYLQR